MFTLELAGKWFDRLATVYDENRDHLTDLDAAIGDGDHGVNMARGLDAVRTVLAERQPATLPDMFHLVSTTLIKYVGGASGPLYGALFMKSGPLFTSDEADTGLVLTAFRAGVDGIRKMGKAGPGEKTMLDAWLPALDALDAAVRDGVSFQEALDLAAEAARSGAIGTMPLQARKGRASYLGEQSLGRQDPGATSAALMLQALADAARE